MYDICVLSLYFNCYSTATTLTTNWDWPDDWACGIVTKSKRAHTHLQQSRLCNKLACEVRRIAVRFELFDHLLDLEVDLLVRAAGKTIVIV